MKFNGHFRLLKYAFSEISAFLTKAHATRILYNIIKALYIYFSPIKDTILLFLYLKSAKTKAFFKKNGWQGCKAHQNQPSVFLFVTLKEAFKPYGNFL